MHSSVSLGTLIIISAVLTTTVIAGSCGSEPKCRISRVHGMKSADCFKKDIRTFPQCLSSDVEIVDLSQNRIRKLKKDDLERYSNVKMLYLADNTIVTIDPETFEGMSELHTLDLSLNAISKLPPAVFHLPSLKTLYLGQNLNINIADVVEATKPITSPLVHLDISGIMTEEADELPDLGLLPFLTKFNISGNKLLTVTTRHFAGLCNLKVLDSSNVTVEFDRPCHCWTVNKWLQERSVKFTPFQCDVKEDDCYDELDEDDIAVHAECMNEAQAIVQKALLMKIFIPVAVVVIILLLCGIFFFVRIRRRRSRNQQMSRAAQELDGKPFFSGKH